MGAHFASKAGLQLQLDCHYFVSKIGDLLPAHLLWPALVRSSSWLLAKSKTSTSVLAASNARSISVASFARPSRGTRSCPAASLHAMSSADSAATMREEHKERTLRSNLALGAVMKWWLSLQSVQAKYENKPSDVLLFDGIAFNVLHDRCEAS